MLMVTFGKPLFLRKWELVARGTNPVLRGLELSVPPPDLQEGRGAGDLVQSPMANDLISLAYVMKSP